MKKNSPDEQAENLAIAFGIFVPPAIYAGWIYQHRDTYISPFRVEHAAASRELSQYAVTVQNSPKNAPATTALSYEAQRALNQCNSVLQPSSGYDAAKAAVCVRTQAGTEQKLSNIYSDMAHEGIMATLPSMLFIALPLALAAGALTRSLQGKKPQGPTAQPA